LQIILCGLGNIFGFFTLKIYLSSYQIMRHRIIQFVQKGCPACKIFADGVAPNSREDRGVRLFQECKAMKGVNFVCGVTMKSFYGYLT